MFNFNQADNQAPKRFSVMFLTGFMLMLPLTGNTSSQNSLQKAVEKINIQNLSSIIASGQSLDTQDQEGQTALILASRQGRTKAIQELLDAGANTDIEDRFGRTALHFAVLSSKEATRQLIAAGSNVNLRDVGGVTPLMKAAGNGRHDIVELLLDSGARVDFKDYQGNSAVDWSHRGNDPQLTSQLEKLVASIKQDKPAATGENFAEDVFVDVRYPEWFKLSLLDLNEDLEEAIEGGKKGLLVFISTRRCSYCKAFIQNSLSLEDIQSRVQQNFDVIGLEIFDDSEMIDPTGKQYRVKEFVSANKASFTPTLIFYGKEGKKLLKIVGYYPPEKFRKVLDYLEGGHYENASLHAYLQSLKSRQSAPTGIIQDKELFTQPPFILDRRASAAQQPLVVIFEQPDCESCQRFHEQVLGDAAVRRLMKKFEVVQLDATNTQTNLITPSGERSTSAQWFKQLDLSYSPSIVFFDENGAEVMRLDSETRRYRMEGSLQLVLEKAYLQDAQLQRWRRNKAIELFKAES